MYEQTERKGVSGGVAAIVALIALVFGLLSGLILGGAGGFLIARSAETDAGQAPIAAKQTLVLPKESGDSADLARDTDRESDSDDSADAAAGPFGGLGEGFEQVEVVVQPYLGVTVRTSGEVPGETAGADASDNEPKSEGNESGEATPGAAVTDVVSGAPAAEAGLEIGDVIVAVGQTPIETADDLVAAITGSEVGDSVTLTVLRDGAETTVEAVLAGRSTMNFDSPMGAMPGFQMMPFDLDDPELQQMFEQLPPEMRQQMEEMLESMQEGGGFEGFHMPGPGAQPGGGQTMDG